MAESTHTPRGSELTSVRVRTPRTPRSVSISGVSSPPPRRGTPSSQQHAPPATVTTRTDGRRSTSRDEEDARLRSPDGRHLSTVRGHQVADDGSPLSAYASHASYIPPERPTAFKTQTVHFIEQRGARSRYDNPEEKFFTLHGTAVERVASGDLDFRCVVPVTDDAVWCAERDGRLSVLDIKRGTLISRGERKRSVFAIAICVADPETVWVGFSDGFIRVFDASSSDPTAGPPLREVKAHGGSVTTIVRSYDGERMITGGEDFTVNVWNVATHDRLLMLSAHSLSVRCLIDVYGRVFSGGDDGNVCEWLITGDMFKPVTTAAGREPIPNPHVRTVKAHEGGVKCMTVVPGHVWTGGADGTVRVWLLSARSATGDVVDFASFIPVHTIADPHTAAIAQIRVVGSKVWTACLATIFVWDAETFELQGQMKRHEGYIVDFTAVHQSLVSSVWTAGVEGGIKIWCAESLYSSALRMSRQQASVEWEAEIRRSALELNTLRSQNIELHSTAVNAEIKSDQLEAKLKSSEDSVKQLTAENSKLRDKVLQLQAQVDQLTAAVEQERGDAVEERLKKLLRRGLRGGINSDGSSAESAPPSSSGAAAPSLVALKDMQAGIGELERLMEKVAALVEERKVENRRAIANTGADTLVAAEVQEDRSLSLCQKHAFAMRQHISAVTNHHASLTLLSAVNAIVTSLCDEARVGEHSGTQTPSLSPSLLTAAVNEVIAALPTPADRQRLADIVRRAAPRRDTSADVPRLRRGGRVPDTEPHSAVPMTLAELLLIADLTPQDIIFVKYAAVQYRAGPSRQSDSERLLVVQHADVITDLGTSSSLTLQSSTAGVAPNASPIRRRSPSSDNDSAGVATYRTPIVVLPMDALTPADREALERICTQHPDLSDAPAEGAGCIPRATIGIELPLLGSLPAHKQATINDIAARYYGARVQPHDPTASSWSAALLAVHSDAAAEEIERTDAIAQLEGSASARCSALDCAAIVARLVKAFDGLTQARDEVMSQLAHVTSLSRAQLARIGAPMLAEDASNENDASFKDDDLVAAAEAARLRHEQQVQELSDRLTSMTEELERVTREKGLTEAALRSELAAQASQHMDQLVALEGELDTLRDSLNETLAAEQRARIEASSANQRAEEADQEVQRLQGQMATMSPRKAVHIQEPIAEEPTSNDANPGASTAEAEDDDDDDLTAPFSELDRLRESLWVAEARVKELTSKNLREQGAQVGFITHVDAETNTIMKRRMEDVAEVLHLRHRLKVAADRIAELEVLAAHAGSGGEGQGDNDEVFELRSENETLSEKLREAESTIERLLAHGRRSGSVPEDDAAYTRTLSTDSNATARSVERRERQEQRERQLQSDLEKAKDEIRRLREQQRSTTDTTGTTSNNNSSRGVAENENSRSGGATLAQKDEEIASLRQRVRDLQRQQRQETQESRDSTSRAAPPAPPPPPSLAKSTPLARNQQLLDQVAALRARLEQHHSTTEHEDRELVNRIRAESPKRSASPRSQRNSLPASPREDDGNPSPEAATANGTPRESDEGQVTATPAVSSSHPTAASNPPPEHSDNHYAKTRTVEEPHSAPTAQSSVGTAQQANRADEPQRAASQDDPPASGEKTTSADSSASPAATPRSSTDAATPPPNTTEAVGVTPPEEASDTTNDAARGNGGGNDKKTSGKGGRRGKKGQPVDKSADDAAAAQSGYTPRSVEPVVDATPEREGNVEASRPEREGASVSTTTPSAVEGDAKSDPNVKDRDGTATPTRNERRQANMESEAVTTNNSERQHKESDTVAASNTSGDMYSPQSASKQQPNTEGDEVSNNRGEEGNSQVAEPTATVQRVVVMNEPDEDDHDEQALVADLTNQLQERRQREDELLAMVAALEQHIADVSTALASAQNAEARVAAAEADASDMNVTVRHLEARVKELEQQLREAKKRQPASTNTTTATAAEPDQATQSEGHAQPQETQRSRDAAETEAPTESTESTEPHKSRSAVGEADQGSAEATQVSAANVVSLAAEEDAARRSQVRQLEDDNVALSKANVTLQKDVSDLKRQLNNTEDKMHQRLADADDEIAHLQQELVDANRRMEREARETQSSYDHRMTVMKDEHAVALKKETDRADQAVELVATRDAEIASLTGQLASAIQGWDRSVDGINQLLDDREATLRDHAAEYTSIIADFVKSGQALVSTRCAEIGLKDGMLFVAEKLVNDFVTGFGDDVSTLLSQHVTNVIRITTSELQAERDDAVQRCQAATEEAASTRVTNNRLMDNQVLLRSEVSDLIRDLRSANAREATLLKNLGRDSAIAALRHQIYELQVELAELRLKFAAVPPSVQETAATTVAQSTASPNKSSASGEASPDRAAHIYARQNDRSIVQHYRVVQEEAFAAHEQSLNERRQQFDRERDIEVKRLQGLVKQLEEDLRAKVANSGDNSRRLQSRIASLDSQLASEQSRLAAMRADGVNTSPAHADATQEQLAFWADRERQWRDIAEMSQQLHASHADLLVESAALANRLKALSYILETRPTLIRSIYEIFKLIAQTVKTVEHHKKLASEKQATRAEAMSRCDDVIAEAEVCREGTRWVISNLFTAAELQHLGASPCHFEPDVRRPTWRDITIPPRVLSAMRAQETSATANITATHETPRAAIRSSSPQHAIEGGRTSSSGATPPVIPPLLIPSNSSSPPAEQLPLQNLRHGGSAVTGGATAVSERRRVRSANPRQQTPVTPTRNASLDRRATAAPLPTRRAPSPSPVLPPGEAGVTKATLSSAAKQHKSRFSKNLMAGVGIELPTSVRPGPSSAQKAASPARE